MPGLSRNLKVPYFTQPTPNSCQSTVLKMMAAYLEQTVVRQSTGAGTRAILDIRKDVNEGAKRPNKELNSHGNFKWWLEQHFPTLRFEYVRTNHEDHAVETLVRFIDAGFPVLLSVSHARTTGHIVLVTGYANYSPGMCSPDLRLIVHDPNGRFEPALLSKDFGNTGRYTGGQSLQSGAEVGPGRSNRLPLEGVSRHRPTDGQRGTWVLLSASGFRAAAVH